VDPQNPDSGEPTLGYAAAGRVTVLAAQLEARLAAVRDLRDQQLAHNARIAGKRLRYVLEPMRPALPLAAKIIQRLKGLQDLFGEMHDADVFQKEVAGFLEQPHPPGSDGPPEAGLIALSARFAAEREHLFATIREQWLGQQALSFFDDTRRAAFALRAHSPDGVEIERKFLLRSLPRMSRSVRRLTIEQGWLPGERLQERLRRVRGPDGIHWYRTVKSGRGNTRIEIEEETTRDTFSRLWRLTAGRRIRKRRYLREDGNLIWKVDQFLDRDLLIAEVELPTSDTPVRIPDWLEAHIVREVTSEPAYLNVNLAS
jgi:CYTH domain-containing protein